MAHFHKWGVNIIDTKEVKGDQIIQWTEMKGQLPQIKIMSAFKSKKEQGVRLFHNE